MGTAQIIVLVPNSGPAAGGTLVKIFGVNFVPDPNLVVVFGGTAQATDVTYISPTEITCVTPAGAVGAANVTVSDQTGATLANAFTYVAPAPPPHKQPMAGVPQSED
jgi:hypothetical protein